MSDNITSNNNKRSKIKNKKTLVVIVILIAVLVLAGGIYLLLFFNKSVSDIDNKTDAEVSQQAINSIIKGDYNGGQKILDDLLNRASTPSDQAWIYIQKASVAVNLNKYDEAYGFAQKAEELYPDINSAQMMALAAVKKGDKADAIVKYELAKSRITGTSGMDDLDRETIQGEINKLKD